MVRKFLATAIIGVTFFSSAFSQSEDEKSSPVTLSGYVDGFYRFNFDDATDASATNNYTSFTNSHNSFEIGMASFTVNYATEKTGFIVDLGFGTRASEFSYNESGALAAIKQGHVWYAPSEYVKFTLGKWATHVGYELLDPQLNRNYSMSYMFSFGPFSHTGLKADFSFGEGFGLMLGVANPTDYLMAPLGSKKNFIAQFSKSSDKFGAYLNYVGGKDPTETAVNQIGLTATYAVSDKFGLGYDGTVKSVKPMGGSSDSWWGSALYFNFDPSEKVGVTLRGEMFSDDEGAAGFGTSIFDATLSLNIKPVPNLIIIPEFRLDGASDPIFYKNSDMISPSGKSTGSFVLAAIVSF